MEKVDITVAYEIAKQLDFDLCLWYTDTQQQRITTTFCHYADRRNTVYHLGVYKDGDSMKYYGFRRKPFLVPDSNIFLKHETLRGKN